MDKNEVENRLAAIEAAISTIADALKEDDPDIFRGFLNQAMIGATDGKFPMAVWSNLEQMLGDD